MWSHMVVVSPSIESTYPQEQHTQLSESLTSLSAFDFEIGEP